MTSSKIQVRESSIHRSFFNVFMRQISLPNGFSFSDSQYAWISTLLHDVAFTWRPRAAVMLVQKVWYLKGIFPVRFSCWRASYLLSRPFYLYGGHIEFGRLKEYYGMPRGHSLRYLRAFFVQKEKFTVYFSGRGDHYYIQARHNDLFFPLQSFSGITYKKISPKSACKY